MPKLPKLDATLALQRERDFRLRASLPVVLGSGLDMGSNDRVFWFEVPEGMSRTLYYADHEKYRQQLSRAILPVDPTWLMDALGLFRLDPSKVVDGPVRRPDGKLEIRSALSMPSGTFQHVCFVDPSGGFVTDQYLYEPGGNLIATSQASGHRFYEEHQVVLPHTVVVNLTPASGPPLGMKIDVGNYTVNQLLSGDPNEFAMPQSAPKMIDLTTVEAGIPSPSGVIAPVGYSASGPLPLPLRGTTFRR